MSTNPALIPQCFYCLRNATFKANIRKHNTPQQPIGQIYCCEHCRHKIDKDKDRFYISVNGNPTWHELTDMPPKLNLENIIG